MGPLVVVPCFNKGTTGTPSVSAAVEPHALEAELEFPITRDQKVWKMEELPCSRVSSPVKNIAEHRHHCGPETTRATFFVPDPVSRHGYHSNLKGPPPTTRTNS